MNRFYQIRHMRGAAFLILTGVLALLNQWHKLSWNQSWPLYVILLGVLILAERVAWTADVRDQQAAQNLGVSSDGVASPYPTPGVRYESTTAQTQPPPPENPNLEDR